MQRILSRFWAAQAGTFLVMFALAFPVFAGAVAIAVDTASLYLERRQLQHTADLAAMFAAGDPDNAIKRVRITLADAGYNVTATNVSVVTGHYVRDATLPPSQRFVADKNPNNAVQVTLARSGTLHFGSIFGLSPPEIGVTATASATPRAGYSIGSRLAGLNEGILNAVLGGLLGGDFSFALLDYERVANINVNFLAFLDALAAEIDLTVGTYTELLTADVAVADIVLALSNAAGGNAVLIKASGIIDRELKVEMARLIEAEGIAHFALGTAAATELQINVLHLLSAAAMLADGERQMRFDLGADVPGLVTIGATITVGEAPQSSWFTIAGEDSHVRTGQARLKLDIALSSNRDELGVVDVLLPVYAELGSAEAHLVEIRCSAGNVATAMANFAVTPGILRLTVGETSGDHASRTTDWRETSIASLIGGTVVVTAQADVQMQAMNPTLVPFTYSEVIANRAKTVSTSTPLTSLTTSLFDNLELKLKAGPLNLLAGPPPKAVQAVRDLIAPASPVLDQAVMALFQVLGLGVGEAVLRVHGFDCRNAVLVQ